MSNLLWLNPVVWNMYDRQLLESELSSKNFTLVHCEQNHIEHVKQQYRQAVTNNSNCITDMRCLLAVSYIKQTYATDFLAFPPIHPILIHCALELHQRYTNNPEQQLFIVTPCQSLKQLGASLCLRQTHFFTWNEFVLTYGVTSERQQLKESPIPPGFFQEYGKRAHSLASKQQIDAYFTLDDKTPAEILELLYCPDGCHNGDGV